MDYCSVADVGAIVMPPGKRLSGTGDELARACIREAGEELAAALEGAGFNPIQEHRPIATYLRQVQASGAALKFNGSHGVLWGAGLAYIKEGSLQGEKTVHIPKPKKIKPIKKDKPGAQSESVRRGED